MKIRFKKLIPEAQTPYRKFDEDAGFDFFCTSIEYAPNYIVYHTGIALEIPVGYLGLAFPRSSITNKDLMLKNSVGVIDASYRNEIMFRFQDTKEYAELRKKEVYEVGDRIGQMVFIERPDITLEEADELSITERNMDGFGSTGK